MEAASMTHVTAGDLGAILDEAMAEFRRLAEGTVDIARKADGSVVSRVDLGLDAFLRSRLGRLAPDAAWLSEESAGDPDRLSRAWAWVVDPLDGSHEFARGVPEFAISVGLVEHGRVRAGGVVNPMTATGAACGTDGSWIAWPARPETRPPHDLASAIVSVSRTETEDGSIAPFIDLVGSVRPVGSVAFKLLRVACGIDDLTFSVQGKSEWDVCGGAALLASRDKPFVLLDGGPMQFNQASTRMPGGFAAGPPALVHALIEQLRMRRAHIARVHA
jgi:myo-inositol-1(or 4)-monophosphatase